MDDQGKDDPDPERPHTQKKRTAPNNYRPITTLQMILEILTEQIR